MEHNNVKNHKLVGDEPVNYFTSVAEESNSGLPRTKLAGGEGETLHSGPPDFKSSALNVRSRCLYA